MKLPRLPLLALLLGLLCASAVHAQDAQKADGPKPAEAKPPTEAEKPKPGPGQPADPEILAKIFACLNNGLPQDWKKTWFTINETGVEDDGRKRNFKADFFFATDLKDSKGKKLTPCGGEPVIEGVKALNDYLPAGQEGWTGATFTFTRDGKFNATYDYTPIKPAATPEPAKPAAKAKKPAAKKSDSSSK